MSITLDRSSYRWPTAASQSQNTRVQGRSNQWFSTEQDNEEIYEVGPSSERMRGCIVTKVLPVGGPHRIIPAGVNIILGSMLHEQIEFRENRSLSLSGL